MVINAGHITVEQMAGGDSPNAPTHPMMITPPFAPAGNGMRSKASALAAECLQHLQQ